MPQDLDDLERRLLVKLEIEKAYAAWTLLGIVSLAAGLGIERFLGGVIPDPFVRAISMAMLLFSLAPFTLGAFGFVQASLFLGSSRPKSCPISLILLMSILLFFGSLLAILGIWFW